MSINVNLKAIALTWAMLITVAVAALAFSINAHGTNADSTEPTNAYSYSPKDRELPYTSQANNSANDPAPLSDTKPVDPSTSPADPSCVSYDGDFTNDVC